MRPDEISIGKRIMTLAQYREMNGQDRRSEQHEARQRQKLEEMRERCMCENMPKEAA